MHSLSPRDPAYGSLLFLDNVPVDGLCEKKGKKKKEKEKRKKEERKKKKEKKRPERSS